MINLANSGQTWVAGRRLYNNLSQDLHNNRKPSIVKPDFPENQTRQVLLHENVSHYNGRIQKPENATVLKRIDQHEYIGDNIPIGNQNFGK